MATRSIELYNRTWECPDCGRNATLNIKKCRGCGRDQPVYGIVEEKPERLVAPEVLNPEKKKTRKSRDPLIGTEDKLFVSTLKMKGE